ARPARSRLPGADVRCRREPHADRNLLARADVRGEREREVGRLQRRRPDHGDPAGRWIRPRDAAWEQLRVRPRAAVGSADRADQLRVGCRHVDRSEEHTSELQSLAYLVCRLLLEKKKKKKKKT